MLKTGQKPQYYHVIARQFISDNGKSHFRDSSFYLHCISIWEARKKCDPNLEILKIIPKRKAKHCKRKEQRCLNCGLPVITSNKPYRCPRCQDLAHL